MLFLKPAQFETVKSKVILWKPFLIKHFVILELQLRLYYFIQNISWYFSKGSFTSRVIPTCSACLAFVLFPFFMPFLKKKSSQNLQNYHLILETAKFRRGRSIDSLHSLQSLDFGISLLGKSNFKDVAKK